jgi:hypothetical protein
MGYYMGDYYAGARGDPGIGSFLGGLFKSAVGLVPGGGAITKVVGTIAGAATAGRGIIKAGKGIVMKHPVITAAAGVGTLAAAGTAVLEGHRGRGKCKHINPRTGKCIRRMNPCNIKALRRASRRAHGFLRISRKLVGYYQPRKPKGRAFIKHKRKAK